MLTTVLRRRHHIGKSLPRQASCSACAPKTVQFLQIGVRGRAGRRCAGSMGCRRRARCCRRPSTTAACTSAAAQRLPARCCKNAHSAFTADLPAHTSLAQYCFQVPQVRARILCCICISALSLWFSGSVLHTRLTQTMALWQELLEMAVRGADGPGLSVLDVIPGSFSRADGWAARCAARAEELKVSQHALLNWFRKAR
jgi:hypothetical protein